MLMSAKLMSLATSPTGRYQPRPRVGFRGVYGKFTFRNFSKRVSRKKPWLKDRHYSPWLSYGDDKSILNLLQWPSQRLVSLVVFRFMTVTGEQTWKSKIIHNKTENSTYLGNLCCTQLRFEHNDTVPTADTFVTEQNGCSDELKVTEPNGKAAMFNGVYTERFTVYCCFPFRLPFTLGYDEKNR